MIRTLPLLLLWSCQDPIAVAADVRSGQVRMEVALDRAVDLHGQGRTDLAVEAWRDAHRAWDEVLSPGLAAQLSAADLIGLELHLARIRAEIDLPGGRPDREVSRFRDALVSPLSALPDADGSP